MKYKKHNEAFTFIEILIGLAILIAGFGFSLKHIHDLRSGLQKLSISGPHMLYEGFAVSRLKIFFSKLLEWNIQLCSDGSFNSNCACTDAAYFAYAPINNSLTSARGGALIGNMSLGADLRLSLSTSRIADIAPNGDTPPFRNLIEIAQIKSSDAQAEPWMALIPFHSENEWIAANPFSKSWCDSRRPPQGSVGEEMCKQFESCTQLGATRPMNQLGTSPGAVSNILSNNQFSMCFVFAGNFLTRADNPITGLSNQGLGVAVLENPTVIGLVVAKAKIISNLTQQPITCSAASLDLNRNIKLTLNVYSTVNADRSDVKKQSTQKSIREINGEKLGIPIPNCNAPGRGTIDVVSGKAACLEDPTFIYQCRDQCTFF